MKNSILITWAVVIGWIALLASTTFAGYWQSSFTWGRWMMGQWFLRSNSWTISSNYSTYGANIDRKVTNIANWVEIIMTTKDTTTLEHMKTMFTQNSAKISQNPLIKVERIQLDDWIKMIITSTDTNTIKSIQERSNAAKMGIFGNGWNRGWMMNGWFWRWNGGNWNRWWCAMFQ